jgi:hypothetical protein
MKLRIYLIALVIGFVCWGCNEDTGSDSREESIYFPMKEFVEVHADKIKGKSLIKEVNVNGQKEMTTITPSAEDWLDELDFFIQADINRPALASAYQTEKSDRFLIHTLKEGEKGKVKKIVIEYLKGDIKQVSFQSQSKTPFYTSKTRGLIAIHGVTGLIDNYSVENIQEVIFSKPNRMVISGHVK